jgi:chromosome segregation ATPase
MEELKRKVSAIERKIKDCRRLLGVYEKSARSKVGNEVSDMRDALMSSDKCIQSAVTEMKSFLGQIEHRPAGEVDLKPQIAWLGERMRDILTLISAAEEKSKAAIDQTISHSSLVNDVSQDIAVQKRDLNAAQQQGNALTQQAEDQLRLSERLVREKEADVAHKTREISSNLSEATQLKAKLPELEADKQRKRRELSSKRETASSKKKAAGGFFASAHYPI